MSTLTPRHPRRTPHATPAVVDALLEAIQDNPTSRQEWARLARVRLAAQRKGAARG